jgi:hypothetical protein
MAENIPPQQSKPSWPGASLALFIIGLLVFVPSGLCTALFIVGYPPAGLFFLLFGAVPMSAGGLLVWSALKARGRG